MTAFEIVGILAIIFLALVVFAFVSGLVVSTRGLRETFKDTDNDGK